MKTFAIVSLAFLASLSSAGPTVNSYHEAHNDSSLVNTTTSNSTTSFSTDISTTTTTLISVYSRAKATSTSGSSPSTSATFSGDGTFYEDGLGACGGTNTDQEYVVAISQDLYNSVSSDSQGASAYCDKKINATRNGKTVEVTVVDCCVGCPYYNLDFSPTAFNELGTPDEGVIPITWNWA